MATTQHVSATSTPAARTQSRPAPRPKRRRSGGGSGSLLLGPLALIVGLWLKSHFGPTNALCSTGLGAFGQAVSTTAAHDCTLAGAAVTFGEMLIWIGALVTGLSVLAVIAVGVAAMQSAGKRGAR
jgi:hypothetical protein